ncbi:MAG: DUF6531 domain-containing protein [Rhodoglobus sp.]
MRRPLARTRRAAVATVVVATLVTGAGVTPAWASAEFFAAQHLAERTTAQALAAAAASEAAVLAQSTEPEAEPEAPPVAEAKLAPGVPAVVDAQEKLGATVEFSGFEVPESLEVKVSPLDDVVSAGVASELAATVLAVPFAVTATTGSGAEVTKFPAQPTFEDESAANKVLVDVDPGVELSIDVSAATLEGIDPTTVRIVTRENPGEPWVELPSYYDSETGAAVAESDHLSQFAVIGVPFVAPVPRIVLDPDDNVGYTVGPNGSSTELAYNLQLANRLATQLSSLCNAEVRITRNDVNQPYVSRTFRAAQAAAWNPDVTVTVAFNTVYGYAWGGDPTEGGTLAWGRGSGADTALRNSLIAEMPGYTSRPAHVGTNPQYPWSEFNGLPGAMVHLETLYFDNTDDRGVIDSPGGWASISSGVATGIGKYVETLGFDCTDPVTGGWPAKPSAAELAKWKQLGYHYHQTYGGDPVSFSTGNLIEDEPLFTLAGPGTTDLDLTLIYNSQDGRQSRVGAGWSFGLGARAQRFDDNSVLVVRGDGASVVFNSNGAGGYLPDADVHDTLTELGSGQLKLTSATGEYWVYDAADIDGIGELVEYKDALGNGYTLGYGDPSTVTHGGDPYSADRFVPLKTITDGAGQVIAVGMTAKGQISTLTHPDGRVWTLGYGTTGDLNSITGPDGRTRTFTYDTAHRMLTATDAAGVTYLINQFDSHGRVVKQWDADNNLRTFAYTGTILSGGSTVYTNNEGHAYLYEWDNQSRITAITDPVGGTERFAYDAAGNTTQHTDEAGNVTKFEYNTAGLVTKETTADGAVRTYTYTPLGVVASATDQGGPAGAARTTTFDVTPQGQTTAAHLPDGSTVSFAYTAAGDLSSVTNQLGKTTSFAYDAVGNLSSVTDALGQTTTNSYDTSGRLTSATDATGATSSFVWDAGDRLLSSTDALGNTATYGYDALDHVTSVTDPLGAVTAFTWDELFHLTSVTAPDGAVTRYEYDSEDNLTASVDAAGARTELEVDDLGRPVKVTDAAGSVWATAYDVLGQVSTATDPLGSATSFAYDAMGRSTTVADSSGAVSSASYDQIGRLSTSTDALGGTVTYAYTVNDQVAAVTDQLGKTASYLYDATGNLITTTDRRGQKWVSTFDAIGRTTSEKDPTGATTRYSYDSTARTVSVTNPLGATTITALDAVGRATTVTDPLGAVTAALYDAAGRLTQTTDANGAVSTAAYDVAGRVTTLTDALGGTSNYAYDVAGRVTTATNAIGTKTGYRYDLLGQLTSVIDDFHATPTTVTGSTVNQSTNYTYTKLGQLASTTNPLGAVTKFAYDMRGLPVSETNPLGTITHTSFDALGRATATVDGNGQTTNFAYTARSDVASVAYPDGVTVAYTYDSAQNPILMTDSLGATGWAYDSAGRVTRQTDPNGARLGYEYDTAGQLSALTVPSGATLRYSYDRAGRVSSQSSPWANLNYSYDKVGNLTTQARSSGVVTTNTFDAVGNVTQIRHATPDVATPHSSARTVDRWDGEFALPGEANACPAGAGLKDADTTEQVSSYLDNRSSPSTDISGCEKTDQYAATRQLPDLKKVFTAGDAITYDYAYDKLGNVTGETETLGSTGTTNTSYLYDRLSKLKTSLVSDGTSNQYAYDKAGNRTLWITSKAPDTGEPMAVASTYNAASQLMGEYRGRLEGATRIGYAYNGAGQRTQQAAASPDGTTSSHYTYTGAGKLASITQDDTTTTLGYDGIGRNLRTETETGWGTEETTQVWDGLSVVQQTSDISGTATLLRDAGGQVALQSTSAGDLDNAPAWNLHDRLGSTIATTTANGRVTDLSDYSDFGVPIFDSTGWAGTSNYTGELSDATTGLNSYFSRTYDAFAGTWLTADDYRGTLTNPGSQHRYGYVEGNPSTYVDAYGYRLSDPGAYAPKIIKSNTQRRTADGWDRYLKANPNVTVNNGSPTTRDNNCYTASCASNAPDRHEEQWWNPTTWSDTTREAVGAGLLIAGGVLLVVAAAACIVATVGICGAGIAVGVGVGGGSLALAGAGAATATVVVVTPAAIAATAAATGVVAVGGGAMVLNNQSNGPRSYEPNPLANNGTGPKNVTPEQQAAIDEAKRNPQFGEPLGSQMKDPRWPEADGWVKMERVIDGIRVHWNRNTMTGQVADFKPKIG